MVAQAGDPAVGTLAGDKLYQQRARAALPILVRQAKAGQTVTYGELADELSMPNPRNLDYVLGAVGNSLLALGALWGRRVPPIEALVLNKDTKVPGKGVAWFTPDAEQYRAASLQQKKQIVSVMLTHVFVYHDWDEVLGALSINPLPPVSVDLPSVSDVIRQGGTGEGEAHRKLKEAVAQHPEWLDLPRSMAPGAIEIPLYSGDRVDVVFVSKKRRVAVEVKAAGVAPNEIVRGLFQCVKYSAVLIAEAKAEQRSIDCTAILALGGAMPPELASLRSVLGVDIRDGLDSLAG